MRYSSVAIALAVIASAAAGRELRLRAFGHEAATHRYEDSYYLPHPELLSAGTLGYRDAAASLLWCRVLVYFGDEIVHRGQLRYLVQYTDAILTLDPDFRDVYHWFGTAELYHGSDITRDDVRVAVRYLERGVRRFPDDGELAYDLGATYLYELVPALPGGPERDRARLRGVQYLEKAARQGAGPPWLALANATQLMRLGQTEQAARHVEEILAITRDETTQQELRAQLARLRSANYAEAFSTAQSQLREERRRVMPFLTDDLYLLVRPVDHPPPMADVARRGWSALIGDAPEAGSEGR